MYLITLNLNYQDKRFKKVDNFLCNKKDISTDPKKRFETMFDALNECWRDEYCYGVSDGQCGVAKKRCRGSQKDRTETKKVYQLCINTSKKNWPTHAIVRLFFLTIFINDKV